MASLPSGSAILDTQATIFKRLHPHVFLSRFLDATPSIREDGRSPSAFREASLVLGSLSSTRGSCLVRLGRTTLLAAVSVETARPTDAAPGRGFVVPSLDLSPLCSPRFRPGPPSEEAQVVTERLLSILDASPPVDLDDLCIEYGEAAWCLYVDVVCMSYDGNVLDAAMLAIVGALRDAQIPVAKWDADLSRVVCSSTSQRPLKHLSTPLSCSFGGYKDTHLLSDPTAFESALLSSSLTLVLTAPETTTEAKLVFVHQAGSCLSRQVNENDEARTYDDEEALELCYGWSKRRYVELREALEIAEKAKREEGDAMQS